MGDRSHEVPPAALLAVAALLSAIGTGAAVADDSYTFVNTRTLQEIQVACSGDPRRRTQAWWRANCRPAGAHAAEWTGGSVDEHPDFAWIPIGSYPDPEPPPKPRPSE